MGSPTLQTLQEPISLMPAFELAASKGRGYPHRHSLLPRADGSGGSHSCGVACTARLCNYLTLPYRRWRGIVSDLQRGGGGVEGLVERQRHVVSPA
jgi:hypothetical protein